MWRIMVRLAYNTQHLTKCNGRFTNYEIHFETRWVWVVMGSTKCVKKWTKTGVRWSTQCRVYKSSAVVTKHKIQFESRWFCKVNISTLTARMWRIMVPTMGDMSHLSNPTGRTTNCELHFETRWGLKSTLTFQGVNMNKKKWNTLQKEAGQQGLRLDHKKRKTFWDPVYLKGYNMYKNKPNTLQGMKSQQVLPSGQKRGNTFWELAVWTRPKFKWVHYNVWISVQNTFAQEPRCQTKRGPHKKWISLSNPVRTKPQHPGFPRGPPPWY